MCPWAHVFAAPLSSWNPLILLVAGEQTGLLHTRLLRPLLLCAGARPARSPASVSSGAEMRLTLLLLTCVAAACAEYSFRCDKPKAIHLNTSVVATQSSTFMDVPVPGPERAIDGNKESSYMKHRCAHTQQEKDPWWTLDLRKVHRIHSVVIWNRMDAESERLLGAEVRVGNSAKRNNLVCGVITDTEISEATIFFPCHGMMGQYVDVVIPGEIQFLQLCEVEVYGVPIDTKCFS
uniref:Fucolectin tachylectin-4 pentraxin-1 domain-containing protein n=1 Tax=Leptobrachium leishanense TaxID=445787 RepID=A0A8C5PV18_9ANUR